jgi:hypothetical protein
MLDGLAAESTDGAAKPALARSRTLVRGEYVSASAGPAGSFDPEAAAGRRSGGHDPRISPLLAAICPALRVIRAGMGSAMADQDGS